MILDFNDYYEDYFNDSIKEGGLIFNIKAFLKAIFRMGGG